MRLKKVHHAASILILILTSILQMHGQDGTENAPMATDSSDKSCAKLTDANTRPDLFIADIKKTCGS